MLLLNILFYVLLNILCYVLLSLLGPHLDYLVHHLGHPPHSSPAKIEGVFGYSPLPVWQELLSMQGKVVNNNKHTY